MDSEGCDEFETSTPETIRAGTRGIKVGLAVIAAGLLFFLAAYFMYPDHQGADAFIPVFLGALGLLGLIGGATIAWRGFVNGYDP